MTEENNDFSNNSILKIGLIGCGNWGKNILRDLLALNCQVLVVDIDQAARKRALASGAGECFSTINDLPECHGYVVAVPIPDLARECLNLLPRKKPIFCEKTLIIKPDDFENLKDFGGLDYIFMMHKWHYHPGIEALRTVAESGNLGEIEMVTTTRYAWVKDFHGGDVFWTQAVHDLTVVKHILGHIPGEIQAIKVIENEEGLPVSFNAILGHRPSVLMSVSGRHCDKISGASIEGKKGTASLFNAYDNHITVRTDDGEKKINIDTTFPLYLELKEFSEYLRGGKVPKCDLHHAKEVSDVIVKLKNGY